MGKGGYLVLTFESTHAAMVAQKYLKNKIKHIVMPTPRCISASCGLAVRVEEDGLEALRALLQVDFPVERQSYALYSVDAQDQAEPLVIA